uniref:Helicase ATP-binding domain-containing protein n=1 Tax=Mesocestoides corti TaxID=53468 RepID=A0A5K3FNA8_MESCO
MSTKILLNMVHNASIDDIEAVIMDEVHYVGGRERGHVWEQLLLVLPQSVTLVLLSATLPNVVELADWLGRARGGSEIHVCQTLKRPVLLQHYLYMGRDRRSRNNLYLVVNKKSEYRHEGYEMAVVSWTNPMLVGDHGAEYRGGTNGASQFSDLCSP